MLVREYSDPVEFEAARAFLADKGFYCEEQGEGAVLCGKWVGEMFYSVLLRLKVEKK